MDLNSKDTQNKKFHSWRREKVRQMMLNFLIDYLFVEEKYYVDVNKESYYQVF